ncbi:FtsX-like permease family protein [Finegoldia sp. BIOML-A3]|uniref:FtsX-like permease family protein n=1 Tax=unclassified Finegoldia TaxID=2619637 RepID=UPI0012B14511|nr:MULTISPECIES: ABC transporter permease [unclassified Finegoldia]MSA99188.1 FtsX-like permease family protein [Finegoldia sp. BIOML-A3]MSB93190.1 FtsX-like permease family protein [Finegoldia sp. BIOML-A4]
MNSKLSTKFALKNLKANKIVNIPYVLSTSIMVAILFIMISLLDNKYVMQKDQFGAIIVFGSIIIAIFTFAIIMYANRFLIKRRFQEFGLYRVFGLENRHINRILLKEKSLFFVIISILTIVFGITLGKVLFLAVGKLMQENFSIMQFGISTKAVILSLLFNLVISVLTFIFDILNIKSATTRDLFAKGQKSESEPKVKVVFFILAIILTAIGYYIALTIEGSLESLLMFFVASLLVLFGTYCGFVAITIFVLKMMKKNKNFFYKSKNFITVSGMLYRMKSNAVGLASIAILCTGVVVSLSTTMAIYNSAEKVVDSTVNRDYKLTGTIIPDKDFSKNIEKEKTRLKNLVTEKTNPKNEYYQVSTMIFANLEGNKFTRIGKNNDKPIYIMIQTLDSFNNKFSKNYSLKDGEILLNSNYMKYITSDKITLGSVDYKFKKIDELEGRNIAVDMFYVVVKTDEDLVRFCNDFKIPAEDNSGYDQFYVGVSYFWNSDKKLDGKEFISKDSSLQFVSRQETKTGVYSLFGAFLYIGFIISFVLLIGTSIIAYYKHLSEGIEDRKNIQTMKKVGLSNKMIKKTSSQQIYWMFFLPLFVAVIHSAVASKMLYQLCGIFGIRNISEFAIPFAISVVIIIVVYFVIFKITSNVYYNLVSEEE